MAAQERSSKARHCNQDKCSAPAAYRFTWPYHAEATICAAHARGLRAIIDAMVLHVRLIPVLEQEVVE